MKIVSRPRSWLALIPWLFLILWFLLPTLGILAAIGHGEPLPPDLATYVRAAERIERGEPLYFSMSETHQIWLDMHAIQPIQPGSNTDASVNNIPGPYVYLPTLALWYLRLQLAPSVSLVILFFTVVGFAGLWLHAVRRATPARGTDRPSHWWLLLVIGSFTPLAALGTGNIELLLLFATLVAAWLIWQNRAVWSALVIAPVILIKPFYALFFIAFGLLLLINPEREWRRSWRGLLAAAALTGIIAVADMALWGTELRRAAFTYMRQALDYHWFVLPVEQQTPLSIWNRTPLQGLVAWGVEPHLAQWLALGLWGAALLVTLWLCRGRALSFPLTFALALGLLYWGRPVGWGFLFLEVVVVAAAWPRLSRWPRALLLTLTLALMVSHWIAFVLTVQGVWLRLVTLQSAQFPWESWLVPALAWLALIAAGRSARSEP